MNSPLNAEPAPSQEVGVTTRSPATNSKARASGRFVTLRRVASLRCPRCGQGRLFRSWIQMQPACSSCGLVFERDPGYFLGSTYLNYGATTVSLTAIYFWLHFGWGYSNRLLAIPLVAYCVVVPLLLFPYARAWWLAVDTSLDTHDALTRPTNSR